MNKNIKNNLKRAWKFFWEEDSAWSWIANLIVAFLVIRFIVYPFLGLILGTSYPIVAVISESMEHGTKDNLICGQNIPEFKESFDNYWKYCGAWYEANQITQEEFRQFPFSDGFRKGDVIILWRANGNNLNLGDVLIFQSSKPQPLIHRVVKIWTEDSNTYYQTKGDHNSKSISGSLGEEKISSNRIYGQGLLRIPYLGWVKILFVDAVRPFGIEIER